MSEPYLQHPCPGVRVSQYFGERPDYYRKFGLDGHEGIDFACVQGTPIHAAHDGHIRKIERRPDVHNYGRHVRLETTLNDGTVVTTIYAHLDSIPAELEVGETVKAGTVLGFSGRTGNVMKDRQGRGGWHLHFGVNENGKPVDPAVRIIGGVD